MDAYSINKKLLRLHGRDVTHNLPKFRVVRSETQIEKRHGNYNVFYGDIFIRNETGTRETIKYHYLKPCWILEKLCVINTIKDYLVIKQAYTYEPLHTFLDKDDNPLPLVWRVVEFVIGNYLKAERRVQRTELDDLADEAKKQKKEEDRVKEILFGNDTNVSSALEYKEGIVVPSTFKSEKSMELTNGK